MMNGMMNMMEGMGWGMGLIAILIVLLLVVGIAAQPVLSASCLVRAYPWSCACMNRSTFFENIRFMMSVPVAHG